MNRFFAQFAGNDVAARQARPEAVYERFRRMKPKEFSGTTDPMIAEGWIKSIEVIFAFMMMEDADKVRCATFLFSGDARLWWESASVALDLATLNWEGFKEILFSKYFTEDVHSRLTRKFMQDLRDIENDRHGKRPFQATQSQQQHRKTFQVPRGQQQNKRQFLGTSKGPGPQQQRTNNQQPYDIPQCPNCKRRHTGECRWGSGKCYRCGSTNHMFKECPRRGQPIQGRVFTMVAEEANLDTTLLTDVFASQLNVNSTRIEVNYSVLIPSGEEISANSMVKDIDLEMQGHLVYADLILLPMPKFDVILGMDWLTRNRVQLIFGGEQSWFRNLPRIISCIKARKLIFKGFQAFLASIISTPEVPSQSLSDVPVVRDFTDVFPDDIAGIPPKREMEFSIDLFPDKFVIVFIDDIIIYSKIREEHNQHLRTVLQTFQSHKFYAKFSKCEFWLDRVAFLGHIISSSGIEVDPSKLEAVKQWVVPKNASEIRCFLGLAGYYRKFIQGFSSIAVPLTYLTKKNAKFLWSTECQKSFNTLKQALITAPVLLMPSGQGNFVLYTDASKLGLGAVLMQHDRVIAYASGQLKRLNLEVCSSDTIPRLSTLIIQSSDDQLQKWKVRDESKGRMIYTMVDGIIRYRGRMWVPNVDLIRSDILFEAHMSPYSIHPGRTKMYKDMKLLYWWPEHQRPAGPLKPVPIPE
ncbi:uncharacterized protein LOC142537596 [Primulina tabacum]|uniref:uncharacterized protein LOC142537596 n=1 Tax=Primulina tabacum TaxID=48773 RepID=UPI003F5A9B0A